MNNITIRPGNVADAPILKQVFEQASFGLSTYLWRKPRESGRGEDELAEQRMASKLLDPNQHVRIAKLDGVVAGGIITYAIKASEDLDGYSPMMRSLLAIDNALVGTRYINALAIFPAFRRKGIASVLLRDAREAANLDRTPLSLTVSDANYGAIATYLGNGFSLCGKIKMGKEGWSGEGKNWLLMIDESTQIWSTYGEASVLRYQIGQCVEDRYFLPQPMPRNL